MVGMVKVTHDLDWETYMNMRHWVFCVEKNVPEALYVDEFDTMDGPAEHFLICDKGLPHGTFRCRPEGDVIHLQWLCVLRHLRKKGLGRAALEFIYRHYSEKGFRKVVIAAKFSSMPFFGKCGCRPVSDVLTEAAFPHVKMEMDLENS